VNIRKHIAAYTLAGMRAIRKLTSGELLTKQAEKNYTKNVYVLKLLLNVVTARIEALVVSGNKLLYALSKKSAAYDISHSLTPSINSSLLLKNCDCNQFFRLVNRW
jgi:hypothetical protein